MVSFSNILTIYDIVKNKSYTITSNDEVYYAEEVSITEHGAIYQQRCNIAVLTVETSFLNQLKFAIITFTDDDDSIFVWGSTDNPLRCKVLNEKNGVIINFFRDSTTSLFI
ncbi:MAG: hypothetical protein RR277_00940 [Rikenellaceae bacterium]